VDAASGISPKATLTRVMPSLYRENPERAVYVLRNIDRDLVAQLTPAISQLRCGAPEPITIYLDSLGGNTWYAEALLRLLRAPNQDGQVCQLTTVVTTMAASAAADVLVAGDYAIAYPDAIIYYHGTRRSVESLTTENAQEIAGELKRANDRFALRMAERVVARLLFILATIRPQTCDNDAHHKKPVEAFIELLGKQLSHNSTRNIVSSAHSLYKETRELVFNVFLKVKSLMDNNETNDRMQEIENEKKVIHEILDYEVEKNKGHKNWSLMRHGLDGFHNHCLQILDYVLGNYNAYLEKMISRYGQFLLDTNEIIEYKKICSEPGKSKEWLENQVGDRMQAFWYFVICLCRELQKGENELGADEAYWLGLVDEVIGYNVPCLRVVRERSSIVASS
jgi:ATP-dependent protease ClpP protease subunit